MPRIIDVSVPVCPGMLKYPGDPVVSLERISDMSAGATSNLSILSMSTHTGNHVDPPIHFVSAGATIDRVPLDRLIGAALLVDMRGIASIGIFARRPRAFARSGACRSSSATAMADRLASC